MEEAAIELAIQGPSDRKAARTLETLLGYQVISHETIRKHLLAVSSIPKRESVHQPVLFVEVDGLYVKHQRRRKKGKEVKIAAVHQGRDPGGPVSIDHQFMDRRIIIESLHQEFLKRLPKRLLPVMNEMAFILQPHPFPVDFPSLMNSGDFYFLSLFPSPLMFDIKAVHFHKENRLVHGLPFGILDASKRCFRIVSWLITR